jgi:hypothetical protein
MPKNLFLPLITEQSGRVRVAASNSPSMTIVSPATKFGRCRPGRTAGGSKADTRRIFRGREVSWVLGEQVRGKPSRQWQKSLRVAVLLTRPRKLEIGRLCRCSGSLERSQLACGRAGYDSKREPLRRNFAECHRRTLKIKLLFRCPVAACTSTNIDVAIEITGGPDIRPKGARKSSPRRKAPGAVIRCPDSGHLAS